tara:strand:- start:11 stop:517 length:507 start_codon:yes stop_codon:yes gene_type:complete
MRKRIHNSKKFPVYKHTTIISGKKVSREIVKRPDIAAIVAIEDTKIILVEQNRFPNGIDLEIPSGHLERKEKPIDCAFREFREETGYEAKKMIPFLKFYTTIGHSTQKVYCFVAQDIKKSGKPILDDGEFLKIRKIDYDKMVKMIISGKVVDSITISAILTHATKTRR